MGVPTKSRPDAHYRGVHAPHVKPGQPKAMVVKVQVPYLGSQPIMRGRPMFV